MFEDCIVTYEYSLIDIYYWIKKRLKLVVIVCVIGALLGFVYSIFIKKPTQTSKLRFDVVIANADRTLSGEISTINNAYRVAGIYMTHLKSIDFAEKVAANVDNLSAGSVQSMIQVTQVENTGNLIVSVSSRSAKNSLNVASAIADLAPTVIVPTGYISENFHLRVISQPQLTRARVTIKTIITSSLFGAFLALMLVVMYVVWIESKKGTIRKIGDIQQALDVPVIGVIYKD
jgi:capsular polysaccharide biosynthesis protein